MIKAIDKNKNRLKRHLRVTKKVKGTAARPRICVFKSNKYLYAQAVDDVKGITMAAFRASKTQASISTAANEFVKKLKENKINNAVYDRGGYKYHGRVALLADSLRSNGIKI